MLEIITRLFKTSKPLPEENKLLKQLDDEMGTMHERLCEQMEEFDKELETLHYNLLSNLDD